MIQAKIEKLSLAQAMELYDKFNHFSFHQLQDPIRCHFINAPCFVCRKNDEIIAFAVIQKHRFKRATIWFGPVIKSGENNDEVLTALFDSFRRFGIWQFTIQSFNENSFKNNNDFFATKKSLFVRYKKGWATAHKNINVSLEEIENSFSTNHKRSIKKAQKNNVEIKFANSSEDVSDVLEIMNLMYKQRRIHHYPIDLRNIILGEFEYFKTTGRGDILMVLKDDVLIGCVILLYNNESAFYIYGASNQLTQLPVLHSAFYNSLIRSKDKGLSLFDFGGYDGDFDDAQFADINRFKDGFGVNVIQYPDKIVVGISKLKGYIIERLLSIRNFILRLRGKHVS